MMKMKILIAYGSANGSTRSIAERIQQRLGNSQIGDITLQTVEKDSSKTAIDGYDVLIIGSAIHMRSWLTPSQTFLRNISPSLHTNPKPTWAFSVGLPPPGDFVAEEKEVGEWIHKQIPLREHKLFEGKFEKGSAGFVMNFFFKLMSVQSEDRRDWKKVDGWADGIVEDLRKEASLKEN